jgi:hypothetical protein
MARHSEFIADDDGALLAQAAQDSHAPEWEYLDQAAVALLTSERGIDYTTAVLYDRLIRSRTHGPVIAQIERLRHEPAQAPSLAGMTCAVAPGAFYREFPHTGADGRILRDAAEQFGCRTTVIPTASTGALESNATAILDWLRANTTRPVILASVSKGGSDVKAALARPGAAEAFQHVVAWVSVCGILDGSPMVNWLLHRRVRLAFYRFLFRWRGYNFDVIRDLRYGPGAPLNGALRLPRRLEPIHVIGFPLSQHMTNRLTCTLRQRIAALGPNDGSILLADACRWPGVVLPVWGADHYLRPSWELRTLARAIFAYLGRQVLHQEPCA